MIRVLKKITLVSIAAAAVTTAVALPASAGTAPARLTASVSSTAVDAGRSVIITGTLTAPAGSGWRPVSGAEVPVSFCIDDFCGEPVATPVTDASGRYRTSVTPFRTGTYHLAHLTADPSVADATADTPKITVLQPSDFTGFTAARDSAGKVAVAGTVEFPGNFTPSPIPVQIQYLGQGSPCFTTVATADAEWNGTTFTFSASADQSHPGIWRAFYAGTPDFFHSATSKATLVL
jgi:hypothetical protein